MAKNKNPLGEAIMKAREAAGLTRSQLAEKTGLSTSGIYYFEMKAPAGPDSLAKITKVLPELKALEEGGAVVLRGDKARRTPKRKAKARPAAWQESRSAALPIIKRHAAEQDHRRSCFALGRVAAEISWGSQARDIVAFLRQAQTLNLGLQEVIEVLAMDMRDEPPEEAQEGSEGPEESYRVDYEPANGSVETGMQV